MFIKTKEIELIKQLNPIGGFFFTSEPNTNGIITKSHVFILKAKYTNSTLSCFGHNCILVINPEFTFHS